MYVNVCVFVFARLHHFYHHLLLLLHHNHCSLLFVLCRINVDLFASTHSSWFCTPASKYGNSYLIFSQKYDGVLSPPLAVLPCASLCLYYHHSVLQVCVCMYVYMHVCRHKQKSAPPPSPPSSPAAPAPFTAATSSSGARGLERGTASYVNAGKSNLSVGFPEGRHNKHWWLLARRYDHIWIHCCLRQRSV